jgi:hypothetical protein
MGLLPSEQLELFDAIDSIMELRGAGVGYDGDGMCQELRPSNHSSGLATYVVLQELDAPPVRRSAAPPPPPAHTQTFMQRYGRELIGTALSCAGAGLSIAAVGAEGLATPVSGGTSLILLSPTVAAAAASSAQCGISLGRIFNSVVAPDNNELLDSSEGFQTLSTALDLIALGGTALSAAPTLRQLLQIQKNAKMVGGIRQALRAAVRKMSAQERQALAKEMEEVLDKSADATARQALVRGIRAGKFPGVFNRGVISQALRRKLAKVALINAGSASLTVGGSTAPAVLSSSSGVVNTPGNVRAAGKYVADTAEEALDYAIHLIQE